MKGKTLSAIVMMLILLVACFVSVPVMSGEHPWDADGSGGSDDTRVITTRLDQPPEDTIIVNPEPIVEPPIMSSSWYVDVIVAVAVWYATEISSTGTTSTVH